ncbi:MAG: hypothetical protein M1541_04260, partial [Acidobacteria bacterium]|nr:hypothetical protein [Acidobacteriota bacterium]
MNLTPDDPKLTAYVLEELDPAEQAAVGATIQNSAPLYEEALQIYATARWLADELKDAPQLGLDADREAVVAEAIEQRAASGARAFAEADEVDAPPNVLPLATWVWRWGLAATALAACLVLAFFSWQRWGKPQRNSLMALAERSEPPAPTSPPPEPQPGGLTGNGPAGQNSQPATVPPGDSIADTNAGMPAESTPPVTNPPRPMQMDIRMMMRYGLVPKGFKITPDSSPGRPPPPVAAPYTQGQPIYDSGATPWRYRPSDAASGWPALRYGHHPSTRAPGTESYAPIRENGFLDP